MRISLLSESDRVGKSTTHDFEFDKEKAQFVIRWKKSAKYRKGRRFHRQSGLRRLVNLDPQAQEELIEFLSEFLNIDIVTSEDKYGWRAVSLAGEYDKDENDTVLFNLLSDRNRKYLNLIADDIRRKKSEKLTIRVPLKIDHLGSIPTIEIDFKP